MSKKWYSNGFGMNVIIALQKRVPKFESGVFHLGGIATGHWVLAWGADKETARRIADVFDLYESEDEFVEDCL